MREMRLKSCFSIVLLCLSLQMAFAEKKPSAETAKPAPVPAASESEEIKPYIASVEVFGTTKFDKAELEKNYGTEMKAWFKEGLEGNPEKALKMQEALSGKIKKR